MPDFEFYAPFAHIEGKYEVCRIRSASHGVFDTFIVLGQSASDPATVYVNSAMGEGFMAERFPECTIIRVAPSQLVIQEESQGRIVSINLTSDEGPVTAVSLRFVASPQAMPVQVPYGGNGQRVWGSRWTCFGVDLNLDAHVEGTLNDGELRRFQGVAGIVTLGSFGRLERLEPTG